MTPMVRKPAQARGLTLVEALLAAMILAFSAVAVSQALLAGHQQTQAALHHRRATDLADALMEEILRLPYNDPDGASSPGPEAGETSRLLYDNIDDYHGFSETAGSVTDVAGAAYDARYELFSRSVTVTAGSQTVAGLGPAITGVTIQVTVTDTAGATWSVQRFVAQP